MAQYIDKDALVAELDLRINNLESTKKAGLISKRNANERIGILKGILSLINSLEVKEVEIEKELESWRHKHFHGRRDNKGAAGEWLERTSQLDIARHFFELGLRASLTEDKYKVIVKGSYTTTTK